MEISVDLTLSPLQNTYEQQIVNFIKNLRASGLTVKENPLSTQVYGDFDQVMTILHKEIKKAFQVMDQGLIHIKMVKTDRSDYEPHF